MNKTIFTVIAVLVLAGCGVGPVEENPAVEAEMDKITVAATFYPLAEFARNTGGENIIVIQIIPNGAEPHEYEPTAKDLVRIYDADIFLVNGANLDTWAEKIKPELEQKGVKVLVMDEYMQVLVSDQAGEEHDDEDPEHEADGHSHVGADPHFWLDPINAIKEVELIRDSLIEVSPDGKDDYLANAQAYINRLLEIDAAYKSGLSDCARAEIITSHAAFGYLAERYGFSQTGILGISPQEEPSARKIAELANLAKEKNIKYIFFETLVSPRLAETLAGEVGAQTLLLHPIGGLTNADIVAGKNYVTLMRENLESLITALECR